MRIISRLQIRAIVGAILPLGLLGPGIAVSQELPSAPEMPRPIEKPISPRLDLPTTIQLTPLTDLQQALPRAVQQQPVPAVQRVRASSYSSPRMAQQASQTDSSAGAPSKASGGTTHLSQSSLTREQSMQLKALLRTQREADLEALPIVAKTKRHLP